MRRPQKTSTKPRNESRKDHRDPRRQPERKTTERRQSERRLAERRPGERKTMLDRKSSERTPERAGKAARKIYAPVNGKIIPLEDLKDPIFAQKMYGPGVAFQYSDDMICSPCQGTLVMVAPNSHCVGIESENGEQVLLEIGRQEQNTTGHGYHILLSRGQKVKIGQPVMRLDRRYLDRQNIDLTLALVVTNRLEQTYKIITNERAVVGRVVVMERI